MSQIRPRTPTQEEALQRSLDAYREAYHRLYFRTPQVHYDGRYVRGDGLSTGVDRKRLAKITRDMLARAV